LGEKGAYTIDFPYPFSPAARGTAQRPVDRRSPRPSQSGSWARTSGKKGLANSGADSIVIPYALVGQELHADRTSELHWAKRHTDTAAD